MLQTQVQRTLSQPEHRIRLFYDQRVPMRDGVRLSTDLYLPRTGGPFPTILLRTPYQSNAARFMKWAVWFATRGYAVAIQDCRGKSESEGEFYAYFDDGRDAYDTMDWLVDQAWCNGKIGTYGRSYGALWQWLTAPLGHPNLTAMAPHVIMDDYFLDYHYVGGAFQLALSILAGTVFASDGAFSMQEGAAQIYNNADFFRHLPLIDMDVEAIGREIPHWRDWLTHSTYDDYWRTISTQGKHDRIAAPAFQQMGWFDPYVNSAFRNFNAMRTSGKTEQARTGQKLLVGPWTHDQPASTQQGDLSFPNGLVDVNEVELRWFDHWLKGNDTGILSEPPIRIYVLGANEWRDEHEWPLARTQFTPYYLHSNGRANSLHGDGGLSPDAPGDEPPDRFDYDPANPVWSLGGVLSIQNMSANADVPIVAGPVDQRPLERRDDILVYTTRPLERDIEVTGPLEVVLYAASSARDTDFTARLIDVYPDGRSLVLAEGIIRGRYRKSYESPDLLQPGEPDEFRILLYPTSNVFKQGHAIRLDISSSNFPHFSRNLNTGENVATGTRMEIAHQTVLHSSRYPSHILLPVIPV